MEIFVNLLEAVFRLTEGFNPIKYIFSPAYRKSFHERQGTNITLTILAYIVGVVVVIALGGAVVLLVLYGFKP